MTAILWAQIGVSLYGLYIGVRLLFFASRDQHYWEKRALSNARGRRALVALSTFKKTFAIVSAQTGLLGAAALAVVNPTAPTQAIHEAIHLLVALACVAWAREDYSLRREVYREQNDHVDRQRYTT